MSHGDARTTVHGRKLILEEPGWAEAHIAAAMGIFRTCGRTWVTRYAAEGVRRGRRRQPASTAVPASAPDRRRPAPVMAGMWPSTFSTS